MHLETSSNLYGVTVNPFNSDLTSGGSSGGEGALLGLRGSCLGIGTDIGVSNLKDRHDHRVEYGERVAFAALLPIVAYMAFVRPAIACLRTGGRRLCWALNISSR